MVDGARMQNKFGCAVLAMSIAGCVVNGKNLLGGGSSSGSSPIKSVMGHGDASWCKDVTNMTSPDVEAAMTDDFDVALPAIAGTICRPFGSQHDEGGKIEARRQMWMKRMAMTEEDWKNDAVPWVNYDVRKGKPHLEVKEGLAWTATMSPFDQYALLASMEGGVPYILDAMPRLTQMGTLAYLQDCVADAAKDRSFVTAAACQPDLDKFDIKKLDAELRSDESRSVFERMLMRRELVRFQDARSNHDAAVKQMMEKNPNYAKMIEVARMLHTHWNVELKDRAPLFAMVQAADQRRATGSGTMPAGCREMAWAAVEASIAKMGAKPFEGLGKFPIPRNDDLFARDAMAVILTKLDMNGDLGANALEQCAGEPGDLPTERISSSRKFRGPRTASLTVLRRKFAPNTINPMDVSEGQARKGDPRFALDEYGVGYGIVGTVKPQGDVLKITFQKASVTDEVCLKWRSTGRIDKIDNQGKVHYEEECVKDGYETRDLTSPPIVVRKRYATGLKPGAYLSAYDGIVAGVWAKKGDPLPIAVYGVALK